MRLHLPKGEIFKQSVDQYSNYGFVESTASVMFPIANKGVEAVSPERLPGWRGLMRSAVTALLTGAVLAGELTAAGPAMAQSRDQENWHWHMHDGWGHMMGWGGTMFGGLMMLLFWGLIIVLLVLLVRSLSGGGTQSPSQSQHSSTAALDILKERYARGEINKEEYEERKKTLIE
jgi:putative membrane protein